MKQMSGMVKNDKTKFFLAFPFKQQKYHKQRKQESQNKNIKSNSNRTFPTAEKKNVIKKKIALFNEGTIETEQIVIAAVTSYLIYILHFS